MSIWQGGLWGSQRFPNGNGIWKGGLWASQRQLSISELRALLADLFGAGQNGLAFFPQPLLEGEQTLYQLNNGTTLTDASGDPVGLGLEFSQGLERGPELVTNGTFDTDLSGWTFESPWQWSDGRAYSSYTTAYRELSQTVTDRNSYNELVLDYEVVIGELNIVIGDSTSTNSAIVAFVGVGAGNYSAIIPPGYDQVRFARKGELEGYVDNISVKEIPGNHLTQPTSADRPTYNTDGSLHWLAHDGTGDRLIFDRPSMSDATLYFTIARGSESSSIVVGGTDATDAWTCIYASGSTAGVKSATVSGDVSVDGVTANNREELYDLLPQDVWKVIKVTGINYSHVDWKASTLQNLGYRGTEALGNAKTGGMIIAEGASIDSALDSRIQSYLYGLVGVTS